MAGNQYAITYDGIDGRRIVFEVAYLSSQVHDALKRCEAVHPGCHPRSVRADLIGTE